MKFNQIDWLWFSVGILFALFVMPLISQFLGKMKSAKPAKAAA